MMHLFRIIVLLFHFFLGEARPQQDHGMSFPIPEHANLSVTSPRVGTATGIIPTSNNNASSNLSWTWKTSSSTAGATPRGSAMYSGGGYVPTPSPVYPSSYSRNVARGSIAAGSQSSGASGAPARSALRSSGNYYPTASPSDSYGTSGYTGHHTAAPGLQRGDVSGISGVYVTGTGTSRQMSNSISLAMNGSAVKANDTKLYPEPY